MVEGPQVFTDVKALMHAAWGPRSGQDHEDLYDKIGQRLEKLRTLAVGAIGQLVLVIDRKDESYGCSMGRPTRSTWPRVEETLRLGILQGPGIVFTHDRDDFPSVGCRLTTTQYVRAWYGASDWCIRSEAGPIRDDSLNIFWLHLDEPLKVSAPFSEPEKRLEVVAGNEAVYAWFAEADKLPVIRKMGRELGLTLDFPALREHDTRERKAIADSLEQLWAEQKVLRARIAKIMAAGKAGVGPVSLDGVSLTLLESADDAVFVAWGDRSRLQELEQRLRRHMEKLRELGVDDSTPNIHLIRHIAQQLKVSLD